MRLVRTQEQTITRSESLRKRRAQQTTQRVGVATQRATTPPPMPARPVVVRNTTFGKPLHSQVGTSRPRRQYYVALESTGAELRLPALPQIQLGWRLLSGLIALACLIGVFSMLFSSFFVAQAMPVNGLERIKSEEITAAAELQNRSILEIDAGQLQQRLLETFPGLEKVTVKVTLPATVEISVRERTPVIAWRKGETTTWADANGILFPARGEAGTILTITSSDDPPVYVAPLQVTLESATTPQPDSAGKVAAPSPASAAKSVEPKRIDPTLFAAAQQLAGLMPQGTTLAYSSNGGLGWEDPAGFVVYLGHDLTQATEKFAMVNTIIAELSGRGITPAVISVENLDAPYYRMER